MTSKSANKPELLAGCDSGGRILMHEDSVFRVLSPEGARSTLDVLRRLDESLDSLGIVETRIASVDEKNMLGLGSEEQVLRHRRISSISYPHEWCAVMFRDAALFQIDLHLQLLGRDLFLKDSHPWNILFDRGRFQFVDFTSIVSESMLKSESFLVANKTPSVDQVARATEEIFKKMFEPYFLKPLAALCMGDHSGVSRSVENTTLNTTSFAMSWKSVLGQLSLNKKAAAKLFSFTKAYAESQRAYGLLYQAGGLEKFFLRIKKIVLDLPIEREKSAYSLYYEKKGEDLSHEPSSDWNAKQKSVYSGLNSSELKSVLDIACNTGWFALMAAKLGKTVCALDIDEGSVQVLYEKIRSRGLEVTPLVCRFPYFTEDRHSTEDGRRVLINGFERFSSDAVLALGLIHHLILGQGHAVHSIVERLASLCRRRLILEFVDISDPLIQGDPEFFPAWRRDPAVAKAYSLEKVVEELKGRFSEVKIMESFPDTRKIIVATK